MAKWVESMTFTAMRGLSRLGHGLGTALFVMGVVACGGGDDRPDVSDSVGFGSGARPSVLPPMSGGTNASTGGSDAAGEGNEPADPAAPLVTIVSPAALNDADAGDALVASEIDVICKVEKSTVGGAQPVDKSSVTIDMLDAEGNKVDSLQAAPTDVLDQYSARFFLNEIEDNGRVAFRCSAADLSKPAKWGGETILSFIDHGPKITVASPTPDSAHALLGAVRFEFTVEPDPVVDGDEAAEVGAVSLMVNGVEIQLESDGNGTYMTFVDFADQDVFADIANGSLPVIIEARNGRAPVPAIKLENYGIVVDGEGPVIGIDSPRDEAVVGGQVKLEFSVSDDFAGVDPDSVVIELNGKENHYGEGGTWSNNGTHYVFLFDSVQAEKVSKTQATITIRATDAVGNGSDGESLIVYLDNVPPLVDLDPEDVREARERSDRLLCSLPFDPVGSLAANDQATVLDVQRLRALVSDRTNEAPGQVIRYFAAQDLDSVYVYLQPDLDQPLLIDTNGDGDCDELIETRNDLPFQHLTPLAPAGSSWFGPAEEDSGPLPENCEYENLGAPAELCQPYGSDMTRVIRWDVDEKIPTIFAIGNAKGAACTGTDWEIGQFVEPGWFCVAARAEDNVGNVGISRPLRLCYDDGDGGTECSGAPPSCTDGCRPPERVPAGLLF